MVKIGSNFALVIGAAALGLAGGCASQSHCLTEQVRLPDTAYTQTRSTHRAPPERRAPIEEGAGSTWSLVFNAPGVARAHAATEPRRFADYSRNDAALNVRPITPVLASSEWPERERPSLAYARRLRLETRADEILFFERESRYRPRYYSVPSGGGGAWGFWP